MYDKSASYARAPSSLKNVLVFIGLDEIAESIINVYCEDCAASAGGCKHGILFILSHPLVDLEDRGTVSN